MKTIFPQIPVCHTVFCGSEYFLNGVSTWTTFMEAAGVSPKKHAFWYQQLKEKQADWETVKPKLFEVLTEEHGLTREKIMAIFEKVELKPGAEKFVETLRQRGIKLCLISASIDVCVKITAQKIGASDWYANTELFFDNEGNWIDITYNPDEAQLKLKQAQTYCIKNKIDPKDCMMIRAGEVDALVCDWVGGVF